MTQAARTIESPPRGIRIAATLTGSLVMVAGFIALFTIPMPWVEESYVISHGPVVNAIVGVLALVAGTLIANHGPRVRSTEKAASRERIDSFKRQGYSTREATRLGRPMYSLRRRAGRLFGGGVLAVALGVIELAVVSYNMDEIDRLGVTPALGPALSTAVAWALIAAGVVAFVIGVLAASATPETLALDATAYRAPMQGAPPQATAPWVPTHHVPADAMPAYQEPVPGTPVAMLDPDLPVMLLERRGDWAHVRAVNGWEGWVDARRLLPTAPAASGGQLPPMPVG